MIQKVVNLLNGSAKALNVNGSVTPQTFSYSPSSGAAEIYGIGILLKDEGSTSLSNFGSLATLTNGLKIQLTIGGVTTEITNIKDNADLVTRFHNSHFGNGAVLSILGVVTPVGFGETNDIFVGYLSFRCPLTLNGSDSIEVIVRDNLSSVDLLQISVDVGVD